MTLNRLAGPHIGRLLSGEALGREGLNVRIEVCGI